MKTSEIINAAADDITAFGHIKGHALDLSEPWETSPRCVVAAFTLVGIRNDLPREICRAALDAVHEHAGRHPLTLNDDPAVTAEEVVAVLRAAALVEAARESATARAQVSA